MKKRVRLTRQARRAEVIQTGLAGLRDSARVMEVLGAFSRDSALFYGFARVQAALLACVNELKGG